MALLPVSSFPGCVFIEARMLGQPAAIVSQIGLSIDAPECSVAVFSRASGVLFVAGVGSYCAYRICTKYLGKRFVWTLLESARFDNPATADRRLLYACGLPLSDDEDGEYDDCDDRRSRRSSCSRAASEMSLQRLSRYPRRSRGLLAIRQPKAAGVSGVLRRPSTSDRSSQSHPHSSSMSDRSASLRIVWEGQQDWDDEFAIADAQQRESNGSRTRCSPPKVAPSTSVGDMSTVFDEVLSMSSAVEPPEVEEALYAQSAESDDPNHEEILQRCLTDSKYMYESVIVANSEVGSDCDSVISTRSNLRELRKQLTRVMGPKGLWDLTQQKPSTSHLKLDSNEMTDSGFSRSTRSKHSHEPRSLFDSAIGGELFSSEDESVDKPERHVLNPLRESDTTSQVSLEWCDEGLRDETCATSDGDERFAVGDLELEYESNRESMASSSRSSPFNICHDHRPTDSRDLMVYACEKYLPYSPHFKAIQNFYHRRRLRRIAPSPRTADETLRLFITSALYHGYDLLTKSPSTLLESFESCVSECDFLHRWSGTTLDQMREDLQHLADTKASRSLPVSDADIRGLALLVVLTARDVYNAKLAGDPTCSWFTLDSPADVMKHFERNLPLDEICWRLLGRSCDVSIEIHDFSGSRRDTIRLGTSPNCIHWLRTSVTAAPQPLFYVPDD
uniref:BTB domain-containing protein n=1 Tax=Haemonchus contortus TaxID=6289 RepID=A0A7I4YXF4_HAECO